MAEPYRRHLIKSKLKKSQRCLQELLTTVYPCRRPFDNVFFSTSTIFVAREVGHKTRASSPSGLSNMRINQTE